MWRNESLHCPKEPSPFSSWMLENILHKAREVYSTNNSKHGVEHTNIPNSGSLSNARAFCDP